MNHIPREFIDQLIARNDIIDVIQERVQLKKAGKNFVACCPFHQEKTPSFNVSPTKQFYHCFGCGISGNVISFLIDFDHMGFLDAIEFLARRTGLEIPHTTHVDPLKQKTKLDDITLLENVSSFYQKQLKQSHEAIEYLKSRHITGHTAKQFGIGYAPNRWDGVLKEFKESEKLLAVGLVIEKENEKTYYDRFRNRIIFPIRNARGQTIGFGGRVLDDSLPKYLNSPETHLFQKSHELYGWHEALQSTRKLTQVFVVEGYLDVISLHQAGITETVATLGTATSSDHIQKIARQCSHIIFCFDGDHAGRDAAWRAMNSALSALHDGLHIHFLFLPNNEDPDSFVQKNGPEAFQELAKQAMPLSEYFFKQLSSECNLHHTEGRAKLVNLALPLLTKISEGAYLQMLCEELGKFSKFDHISLQRLFREFQQKSSRSLNDTLQITQQYRLQQTPMRLAISLLLQHPECAEKIEDEKIHVLSEHLSGSQLLKSIFDHSKKNPGASTAALLEHWRDTPEFSILSRLAAQEYDVEQPSILLMMLNDCLTRLADQTKEMESEVLLEKMKQSGLSEEEQKKLFNLLKDKSA